MIYPSEAQITRARHIALAAGLVDAAAIAHDASGAIRDLAADRSELWGQDVRDAAYRFRDASMALQDALAAQRVREGRLS